MANKHEKGDLEQMQSLPLGAKISMTKRRIMDWYDYWGGMVYVSFSGGKDSTVLKHIVDSMGLGIPSVFVNTGLEFPEIQRFAMSQPNVTTIRPKMMFTDVIRTYGYPVVSKEISQRIYDVKKSGNQEGVQWKKLHGLCVDANGNKSPYNCEKWAFLLDAPFNVSHKCCGVMKKDPAKRYEKETGRKPITGTMANESQIRKQTWLRHGCNSFDGKRPVSHPMSFWTEQDVLHYIKKYNVPYCSVYGDIIPKNNQADIEGQISFSDLNGSFEDEVLECTGRKRTGCMFCMFGCHLEKEPNRFQTMKETHPRQYDFCINGGEFVDGKWQPSKKGLGLGYVLDYMGVKYK